MKKKPSTTQSERRLSPWRVLVALLLVAGIAAGSLYGFKFWKAEQPTGSAIPWFGAYVDVTATPAYGFEQLGTTENRNAVLSFIVSLPADSCVPAWGAAYTMDQASAELDLDRRIARLQQQGGSIAVSFGGLLNDELALKCTNPAKLKAAYKAVIDKYSVNTIDLDLEQAGLTDPAAAARRATALAELQKERRAAGKNLAIWVTLPVTPQGLTEDGTNAISWLLAGGVDLAGVNLMTMDYDKSRPEGQSMQAASESALIQTHRQLGILYDRTGLHLNSATLWAKLGATPMIGQNDSAKEVFTLKDAQGLNDFVHGKNMGRLSMWSANRDITCGANYVDLKIVSDSCSGVQQNKGDFSAIMGKGFSTSLAKSAGTVTTSESSGEQVPDDPATSPYPIWSETQAFLQGAKIVWHHRVYAAKWWNQAEVPDNPVLQSWQTPWELIGPVLPGEKPVERAKLPAGTFPGWVGTKAYNTGDRILFEDVPYQSRWWNQGESPAAATSNAISSPWAPLTQTQINELLEQ